MTRLAPALLLASILLAGCDTLGGTTTAGARTSQELRDDERIGTDVHERIRRSDWRFDKAHVVVSSDRAVVLIAGQVPSEELRQLAQQVAEASADVRRVHNELVVGPSMPIGDRAGDGWITTKVNSALASDTSVDADLVQVTVVDGTVYLMGRVSTQQADAVVAVTQGVSGVKKIVRVFDYVE